MSADPASAFPAVVRETRAGESRAGRTWALGISFSLILIVCIRFFAENLNVVPAMVQYIDVPITVGMAFCAFLAFIRRGHFAGGPRLGALLYLFISVSLVSAWISSDRISYLPVAMFVFNFAAPLIVALATIHAPFERRDAELVIRTFFWLGVVQLGVTALYGLPRFLTNHNPDYISGTFGLNAYQFTYFIGLWLLFVLGGVAVGQKSKRRGQGMAIAVAALLVFGFFYAAQYRAMLIFFTLVVLLTLWVSPARLSSRLLMTIVILVVSVFTLIAVATAFPNLKLLKVFDLFEDTSPVVQSGKVQAAKNVLAMYEDVPQGFLIGSGPGTFSSRAYMTFATTPSTEKAAVGRFAVDLMGGRLYSTDVADKYVRSIRFTAVQGGTTLSTPQSSFTSLAAEVGLGGMVIYLFAYLMALRYAYRRLRASATAGDRLGTQLAFAVFGGIMLLLIQAVFDNWLETTRVAIPLWVLIGVLYALERIGRAETRRTVRIDAADAGMGESGHLPVCREK